MRLRFINVGQQMWKRNVSSLTQGTKFIREYRKFQKRGFYPVYVGKTEIFESHVNEDVSVSNPSLKNQPTWCVIHAGGALGWVPWYYRLYFYLNDEVLTPDEEVFRELCAELHRLYGNCAIILDPQLSNKGHTERSGIPVYTKDPVELLPMTCCSKVARNFGHAMLQIPMCYLHLSPLNTAWSTTKRFMCNNKSHFTSAYYHKSVLYKVTRFNELVDRGINEMNQRKWADAINSSMGLLTDK
ncbi:hypothetical protein Baya_14138 [Bagarius yarrelli]|uniref:Protein FAM243A n=1 Tax=Bagarius yarrelli TaxID=175774 RepID=A0A556V7Q0_BAGYA|nr:hypothetical protein Baya_14138 [Bagarius yarrelli]